MKSYSNELVPTKHKATGIIALAVSLINFGLLMWVLAALYNAGLLSFFSSGFYTGLITAASF